MLGTVYGRGTMKLRTGRSAAALVLALSASVAASVGAHAATYHPWYDDVGQTPATLDMAADGSYSFIDLRWGPPRNVNVPNLEGTRVARGAIDERVCWGYVAGQDDNPQPFCETSGSKWTIVGRVTLTFASPVADNLGNQWSVVKVQTSFNPPWSRYNRKRAGSFPTVGETPGTTYGYLVGTNGSVPDFWPAPISAEQYHLDAYGGHASNCLSSAYTGGPRGWAVLHTYTAHNMTCGAAASAIARGRLSPDSTTGLITPGFTCRVLSETTVKNDPDPIHEEVNCLNNGHAFTVSLTA